MPPTPSMRYELADGPGQWQLSPRLAVGKARLSRTRGLGRSEPCMFVAGLHTYTSVAWVLATLLFLGQYGKRLGRCHTSCVDAYWAIGDRDWRLCQQVSIGVVAFTDSIMARGTRSKRTARDAGLPPTTSGQRVAAPAGGGRGRGRGSQVRPPAPVPPGGSEPAFPPAIMALIQSALAGANGDGSGSAAEAMAVDEQPQLDQAALVNQAASAAAAALGEVMGPQLTALTNSINAIEKKVSQPSVTVASSAVGKELQNVLQRFEDAPDEGKRAILSRSSGRRRGS